MTDDMYVPCLSSGPDKVIATAGKVQKAPSVVLACLIFSLLQTEGFADNL